MLRKGGRWSWKSLDERDELLRFLTRLEVSSSPSLQPLLTLPAQNMVRSNFHRFEAHLRQLTSV